MVVLPKYELRSNRGQLTDFNMKFPFLIAPVVVASVSAFPSSISNDANHKSGLKIVAGVVAAIATGPTPFLNAAFAASRTTNRFATPIGFLPVSLATDESIWGSKSTQTIAIGYRRNPTNASSTTPLNAKIAMWADINMLPDEEISAIYLNVSNAAPVPSSVDHFVRMFACQTDDRLVATNRAYLRIETDNFKPELKIFSDRFTTKDPTWTSNMAGALFTVQCTFVKDVKDAEMPIRPESVSHSGDEE